MLEPPAILTLGVTVDDSCGKCHRAELSNFDRFSLRFSRPRRGHPSLPIMADRKAELERKKAKLQALREDKERRKREKERKEVSVFLQRRGVCCFLSPSPSLSLARVLYPPRKGELPTTKGDLRPPDSAQQDELFSERERKG